MSGFNGIQVTDVDRECDACFPLPPLDDIGPILHTRNSTCHYRRHIRHCLSEHPRLTLQQNYWHPVILPASDVTTVHASFIDVKSSLIDSAAQIKPCEALSFFWAQFLNSSPVCAIWSCLLSSSRRSSCIETTPDALWPKEQHQIWIKIYHKRHKEMWLLKDPWETPAGVLMSHSFVQFIPIVEPQRLSLSWNSSWLK